MTSTKRQPRAFASPKEFHTKRYDKRKTGLARKPWKELPKLFEFGYTGRAGRPTKLTEAVLARIKQTCLLCVAPSYITIAQKCGVNEGTFQRWLKEFKNFREAVDYWRTTGLLEYRMEARNMALKRGDGKMIRYLLDRRDPDFKPKEQIDVNDITPNNDATAERPEFI